MMTSRKSPRCTKPWSASPTRCCAAAAASDWDRLRPLEQQCAACVRQLKDNGDGPLAGQERARKVEAIRKMLDSDRKIRDLTPPWMAKLRP